MKDLHEDAVCKPAHFCVKARSVTINRYPRYTRFGANVLL
jgi:hypothetical protein